MKAVQIVFFVLLQIVFLPLLIAGFIMVGAKQIFGSKKLGVSGTAIDVLQTRWIYHVFGDREDPYTIVLAKHLPNMSHAGMWLAMLAMLVSKRVLGYAPGFAAVPEKGKERWFNFFYARHRFFDEVFEKNLDGMEQVVLMGAGVDTRSLMFCQKEHLSVFELDQTATLELKKETLKKAGVDTEFIPFVTVDLNHEAWHE